MRFLITGGAGFIGTNLVACLNKIGGHQITVLDNESLGKQEHLAGLETDFIKGDIRDRQLYAIRAVRERGCRFQVI